MTEPDSANTYFRAIIMSCGPNLNGDYFPPEELERACGSFCGKDVTDEIDGPIIGRIVSSQYIPEDKAIMVCAEIFKPVVELKLNKKEDFLGFALDISRIECGQCGKKAENMAEACEHLLEHNAISICTGIEVNHTILHKGQSSADLNAKLIEEMD